MRMRAWCDLERAQAPRYPDAIALAENADDVVEAARLAGDRGWSIGVRSGGLSWSGDEIRDGGPLLDVSRLSDFTLDAETRVASVRPGVRGADLQPSLNEGGYDVELEYGPGRHGMDEIELLYFRELNSGGDRNYEPDLEIIG